MKPLGKAAPHKDGLPIMEPPYRTTWRNDEYVVIKEESNAAHQRAGVTLPAGWTWLSIRRDDRAPVRDWRDMQQIKNQLCGAEREAIEIYPAESRLVDGANQFHLWVLPSGVGVGVGYTERSIGTPEEAAAMGAVQRPFDNL